MIFTHSAYIGAGAASIMLMVSSLFNATRVSETYTYRLVMGRLPFSEVVVTKTEVSGREIRVSGTLKKHRCEKTGHVAYTRQHSGPLVPAEFRSEELAVTPENRPSSEFDQAFGPWVITTHQQAPEYASFYVVHDCPEGTQVNRVFEVAWITHVADNAGAP